MPLHGFADPLFDQDTKERCGQADMRLMSHRISIHFVGMSAVKSSDGRGGAVAEELMKPGERVKRSSCTEIRRA